MSPLYQLQVVFAQNLPHGLAPEGERKFLIDGIVGGKVRIPGIFFVKRFRVFGSKVPVGGPLRRRHGAGGNRGAFRCGFQLCGKVTALLLRGDIALRQELVIGIHDRTHTDLVVCSQLSFGRQLSACRNTPV